MHDFTALDDTRLHITHADDPDSRPRVIIIGLAAAGKSTLAAQLAAAFEVRCVDLDALHWLPNWEGREREDFRACVDEATADLEAGWVVAGNYSACRDILWPRATTLIWLDYPFGLVMRRLLVRTLRRWWTQERLFGGTNTEQLAKIFSRDSLVWWVIKTWRRRKHEYPQEFERPEHAHLQIIHLTSQMQCTRMIDMHHSASST